MSGRAAQRGSRLEVVFAFLFGSVAIAVVLWLAFGTTSLTDPQSHILHTVLALAAGGVAAVLPGFLRLNMKVGTKLALRAGGALAVFLVVYFCSPAGWEPSPAGTVTQTTSGVGSPAQNGSGNTVIINGAPSR